MSGILGHHAMGDNIQHVVPEPLRVSTIIPQGQNLVEKRMTTVLPPTTGATYSSNSGSTIQFYLNADSVDKHSVVFYFKVTVPANETIINDELINSVFSRLVVSIRGQVYEDITELDYLSRILTDCLCSKDYYESFMVSNCGAYRHAHLAGNRLDSYGALGANQAVVASYPYGNGSLPTDEMPSVSVMPVDQARDKLQKDDNKSVEKYFAVPLWKLSHLWATLTSEIIPTRQMGTIKFTFYLNSFNRAMVQVSGNKAKQFGFDVTTPASLANLKKAKPWWMQVKGTSQDAGNQSFTIEDPYLKMDVLTLNSNYMDALDKLANSPTGFHLRFDTFASAGAPLNTNVNDITISRGLSHLKSVFAVVVNQVPRAKDVNIFHPHGFKQAQLRVGMWKIPNEPINNYGEARIELRKAVNSLGHPHIPDLLTYDEYTNTDFILGFNTEQLPGNHGVSTTNTIGINLGLSATFSSYNTMPSYVGNYDNDDPGQNVYKSALVAFLLYEGAVFLSNGTVEPVGFT